MGGDYQTEMPIRYFSEVTARKGGLALVSVHSIWQDFSDTG